VSARLRLAIVRQRYDAYGGAERFIERVLPALERSGVEPTLIARSATGWGARRLLRVDPFYVGSLWRDCSFARASREAWRKEGFDIVQSHERIPGCDVYRAGDGVHARWLELRRAAGGALERARIALNPHHRYLRAAERRMLEHPGLRAVICNSNMVRDEIARGFRVAPEKLHVIRNGVDLEHFHPRERAGRRARARAELGCAAGETVFVFVGSGFARKGLAAAIDALARSRGEAFRLLVAGRDRGQRAFEARARACGLGGRVRFLGARGEVRPLYAAADCFILPSRYDPFPNTALEALAMGLPLIVSSRCGAAELVEPGANGWICEPDDPAGLARLMREAAAADAERIGRAARATAERFGIGDTAARLAALYASLAAGRGRPT
jgi:UDP-glucose:(heptosyl)LPS alpha-1,3-glucosyltransferase